MHDVAIVTPYAVVPVDRRFYVPSGVRWSYVASVVAGAGCAGSRNTFEGVGCRREAMRVVLRVHSSEGELFEHATTLADTLRLGQASLMLDGASGKWVPKWMSAKNLYSGDENENSWRRRR